MTMPASRLVRLPSPDHDGGAVPQRGLPVHEALIAAGRVAAHHADGLELVDDLRDGEQCRHGTEGEASEIHVDAGEHDPHALVGEGVGDRSEEHTSELQSPCNLVCRLLLEKKKKMNTNTVDTLYA